MNSGEHKLEGSVIAVVPPYLAHHALIQRNGFRKDGVQGLSIQIATPRDVAGFDISKRRNL